MENMVCGVLARPEVAKIKFTLGPVSISSHSFKQVEDNILNGKIKVVFTPKLPANNGKYRYTHNTLFLGFMAAGDNIDKQALIIHECTHAAMDIVGKALMVSHCEAAAYVAQCLFFYYVNEVELSEPGVKPTFQSAILQEAWKVAEKARTDEVLSEEDIDQLLKEIARHPLYKTRHSKHEAYDGV